jgi:hypothetical protein
MIGAGEIRKDEGQIRFSLSVLKATQLRPKLKLGDANPRPFVHTQRNQSLWLPSASRILIRVTHG